jgi:hypothetical protein
MVNNVGPNRQGLSVIIDGLGGGLPAGEKFLVGFHEGVDPVATVVEL